MESHSTDIPPEHTHLKPSWSPQLSWSPCATKEGTSTLHKEVYRYKRSECAQERPISRRLQNTGQLQFQPLALSTCGDWQEQCGPSLITVRGEQSSGELRAALDSIILQRRHNYLFLSRVPQMQENCDALSSEGSTSSPPYQIPTKSQWCTAHTLRSGSLEDGWGLDTITLCLSILALSNGEEDPCRCADYHLLSGG